MANGISDQAAHHPVAPGHFGGQRAHRHRDIHHLRILLRPQPHLHAAHGAADHREQGLDLHGLDKHGLGADHVGDGDDRELQPVGLAGGDGFDAADEAEGEGACRLAAADCGDGGGEGDLQREVSLNIKRLKDIKAYRGLRHARHLPTRGQRTKTNSRTVRGNVRKTMTSGRRTLEKT